MGTFIGHLIPGLAFALLGLWHSINTIKAYYLNGVAKFKSRFWHPFWCPLFRFEHLELVAVLSFSILAILVQVLELPHLSFSFKLDNLEHASMFLHLSIFAGFSLFADLIQLSDRVAGVTGILATTVFGQELFLLHYHSANHVGLEGHYHWLLQLIVFTSLVSALCSTSFPSSFPAALALCISVVFQGCWFVNMGFMLWVPYFVPRGCIMQSSDNSANNMLGSIVCPTHEADLRARALSNLQFSWILAGILVFFGCTCINFARESKFGAQLTEYEQLNSRSVDAHRLAAVTVHKSANP